MPMSAHVFMKFNFYFAIKNVLNTTNDDTIVGLTLILVGLSSFCAISATYNIAHWYSDRNNLQPSACKRPSSDEFASTPGHLLYPI